MISRSQVASGTWLVLYGLLALALASGTLAAATAVGCFLVGALLIFTARRDEG